MRCMLIYTVPFLDLAEKKLQDKGGKTNLIKHVVLCCRVAEERSLFPSAY